MHDIYKQKCLVKSIYLVLQIKHCKKVRSSIGFKKKKTQIIPQPASISLDKRFGDIRMDRSTPMMSHRACPFLLNIYSTELASFLCHLHNKAR